MEQMGNETWIPVKGYEGLYEINEKSEVRSLSNRNYYKIMQQRKDRAMYWTVRLSNKGKDSTVYVHRLLGFAFIKNPLNKPFINHIDGNKLNNSLNNLEWVTHSENMLHAYNIGLLKIKAKSVYDTCTGKIYSSIKEAAKALNINYGTCRNYLNGNIKTNNTCLRFAA